MAAVARAAVLSPARVALPGGLWRDGTAPLRELSLRPAQEGDLIFVLDSLDAGVLPCTRATALLQRCLTNADEGTAHALSVGDREALLLHLRRLTFGDAMDCVLSCPACGEPMELALHASELLTPAYAQTACEHSLLLEQEGTVYALRFRLPTAADLDAAAGLVREDAELAGLTLLQRCLADATRDGQPAAASALPAAVREAVAAAMAERDPQAEIELDLTCPACCHAFPVGFDSAAFLLQELDERAALMLREVHLLASHYGWSERDILQMPAHRRARYVGLIADAQTHAGSQARAP